MKKAVLLIIILLLIFCSTGYAADTPTKSSSENILIHVIGDYTLPIGFFGVGNAVGDVEDWVNRKGGIKGVPVKFVLQSTDREAGKAINYLKLLNVITTGMTGEEVIAYYNEILEQKPKPVLVLNFDFISNSTEALKQRFGQDEVVCFTTNARVKTLYPPGFVFSVMPTYEDQFALFIDWLSEEWAVKHPEKPKLAILTPDTPLCKAIISEQTLDYCRMKGVDIVAQEVVPLTMAILDITPQLKRIKARGANWIFCNIGGSFLQMGLMPLQRLGLVGKIHFAVGTIGMDAAAIYPVGDLAEGMIGVSSIRSWDEVDHPGIKEVTEEFERHHRKPEEKSLTYLLVFALGAAAVEVMERAVDRVGLENLNGRVIEEEIEKIEDFRPLDLTNLTILPGKRSPSCARIEEVKGGKILPLTDWYPCPDMRPPEHR